EAKLIRGQSLRERELRHGKSSSSSSSSQSQHAAQHPHSGQVNCSSPHSTHSFAGSFLEVRPATMSLPVRETEDFLSQLRNAVSAADGAAQSLHVGDAHPTMLATTG